MKSGKKSFCSWSGGKDSCLALNRALRNGYDVRFLLTMFDENADRSRSHAVPRKLIEAQAAALGIELVTAQASWQNYETVFTAQLREFQTQNITHGIFGDIDLQAHRDWEEKVCAAANIEAVLPLWNENRRAMVDEFLAENFKAVVVCVNENYLDTSFCGRIFDENFVSDLPETVDVCGENGEFHTFVFDGELFRNPIKYEIAEIYRHELEFPSGDVSKFAYARLAFAETRTK
ncbi:MAG: diphthine--ammonia ligase [Acidobacteriota bacterium]|nr:diphthine--ammonia ligase [Acidobacteriota bacterium]